MKKPVLRRFAPAAFALGCLVGLCACRDEAEVRIQNLSGLDFTEVRVADRAFGNVPAGTTSPYRRVELKASYAVIELTADGQAVTGQTLNLGADRFTYEIDVVDLEAGQLAIEVRGD